MHPSVVAMANLSLLRSTPMMRDAPAILAACTTARPTAPNPKTATLDPAVTCTQINVSLIARRR